MERREKMIRKRMVQARRTEKGRERRIRKRILKARRTEKGEKIE
jgi:hypothetical protein